MILGRGKGSLMARPTKWRKIEYIPDVSLFVPSAADQTALPENVLKMEELEAVRLKDLNGLEQEECAAHMEVSRPTFQRILLSAREKITDSLINGKAIRIEGGNYTLNICPVKCRDCGRDWAESIERLQSDENGAAECPQCHSRNMVCREGQKGRHCGKGCRRYGRGR